MEKHTIRFRLVHKGEEFPVYTHPGQYYSLMMLISDYLALPEFGLCCGMGSCGTCMVDVHYEGQHFNRSSLSCDLPVDDTLENAHVVIGT